MVARTDRPELVIPPDLEAALAAHPGARAAFETLSYTHRREHIDALVEAKRPETRTRRLRKAIVILQGTRPALSNTTSTKPAWNKLGVRAGARVGVLLADDDAMGNLGELPAGSTMDRHPAAGSAEVVVLFARDAATLEDALSQAADACADGGRLWVAFPKQSSGRATTLTRDHGWDSVKGGALRFVALISLDATWSAVRLAYPTSGRAR